MVKEVKNMAKRRKNRITKSEWSKIIATSVIMVLLVLLRWFLGSKVIPVDWEFILGILDTTIAFMFIPLFFFIAKEMGLKVLSR